jgi:hypothetical protein
LDSFFPYGVFGGKWITGQALNVNGGTVWGN